MKILFSGIGLLDTPNAAFLRTFYFARELANKGHEVTLLTTQKSGYIFPYQKKFRDKLMIIAVPSLSPLKMRKFGYGIISIIIRVVYMLFHRYDIVHSDNHRPASSFPCKIHSKLKGSKYIAEWWDYFGRTGQYDSKSIFWKLSAGPFDNFLEKYTRKVADGVVVLSELLKERALELGHNETAVEIVWGGSDIQEIDFFSSTKLFREKFNLPEEKFIFMSTGMGPTEILEYRPFFEALNKLQKKRDDFIFARTGQPVPSNIKTELNLGNYFFEMGYVDYVDYQNVLACANMFVLIQFDNNKNKGRWPNCTGDYLAAGRPILFNDFGDLKKFKHDCPYASVVVDVNKIDSLSERINDILNNKSFDFKNRKQIRKFAEDQFSWKNRAEQLYKFYCKILINE